MFLDCKQKMAWIKPLGRAWRFAAKSFDWIGCNLCFFGSRKSLIYVSCYNLLLRAAALYMEFLWIFFAAQSLPITCFFLRQERLIALFSRKNKSRILREFKLFRSSLNYVSNKNRFCTSWGNSKVTQLTIHITTEHRIVFISYYIRRDRTYIVKCWRLELNQYGWLSIQHVWFIEQKLTVYWFSSMNFKIMWKSYVRKCFLSKCYCQN